MMTLGELKPSHIDVGVVGLGLMGSSIVVALLISGHQVKAIAPIPEDEEGVYDRIADHLRICADMGILFRPIESYLSAVKVSTDYDDLRHCGIVMECVIEKLEIKKQVYQKITDVVNRNTIISSNTSAIPISRLQQYVSGPDRFLGIHWAEPAFSTRFLEITCGEHTDLVKAEMVYKLAHNWQKEPTLLKKDIRGFITNRLMYAVYREALSAIEKGVATLEDADKAFRYDAGSWITMMGIFKRMDFEGLDDHYRILKNLLPQLSNQQNVPSVMQKMVDERCRGIHNGKGLYPYTAAEAELWDSAFSTFSKEIYKLANQYPEK